VTRNRLPGAVTSVQPICEGGVGSVRCAEGSGACSAHAPARTMSVRGRGLHRETPAPCHQSGPHLMVDLFVSPDAALGSSPHSSSSTLPAPEMLSPASAHEKPRPRAPRSRTSLWKSSRSSARDLSRTSAPCAAQRGSVASRRTSSGGGRRAELHERRCLHGRPPRDGIRAVRMAHERPEPHLSLLSPKHNSVPVWSRTSRFPRSTLIPEGEQSRRVV
jgi:hypothetical protein